MQQQEQLSNLLDTVPDQVMICSKGDDSHFTEVLYTNRSFSTFYGWNYDFSKKQDKSSLRMQNSIKLKR